MNQQEMTPQDKAAEFIANYRQHITIGSDEEKNAIAKQCATECVDCLINCCICTAGIDDNAYYKEVKICLENM